MGFFPGILSKSYFKDKREAAREDELAARVKGIIGQAGQSAGQGPMQPQGLLGDNLTPEQFSTQLGQQMMGVPGYENNATNLLNQMTVNRQSGANNMNTNLQSGRNNMNTVQGAWDRNMYNQNNLSADQGRQQQNSDRAFNAQQASTRFNQLQAIAGDYTKSTGFDNSVVREAANIDNMMADVMPAAGDNSGFNPKGQSGYQNINGSQLQTLTNAFFKTMRPEALMSDDLVQQAKASGFTGEMADLATWLFTNRNKHSNIIKQMHDEVRRRGLLGQQRINQQNKKVDAWGLTPMEMQMVTGGAYSGGQNAMEKAPQQQYAPASGRTGLIDQSTIDWDIGGQHIPGSNQ